MGIDIQLFQEQTLSLLIVIFLFETLYIHTCCKVLRMSGFQLVESQYLA